MSGGKQKPKNKNNMTDTPTLRQADLTKSNKNTSESEENSANTLFAAL